MIGKELEVVVEKFEDTKGNLLLSKEKADFIKQWDKIKSSFENEEVINGITYYYVLTADYNEEYESEPSNEVYAMPASAIILASF